MTSFKTRKSEYERSVFRSDGKHFERGFRNGSQAAPGSAHELRNIETSRVFDYLAASSNAFAETIDEGHAENEVAEHAKTASTRTGKTTSDDGSDGKGLFDEWRIERKVLAMLEKGFGDVAYFCSSLNRYRVLVRLVLKNTIEFRK